jgi:hypothetical protein
MNLHVMLFELQKQINMLVYYCAFVNYVVTCLAGNHS